MLMTPTHSNADPRETGPTPEADPLPDPAGPWVPYQNRLSRRNRLARLLWGLVWALLFRPSPRVLTGWRRFLLRCFGAKMGAGSVVHPSTRIWAPWNLEMAEGSCLSFDVDCYCVASVRIGTHATVSQYSHLCTAEHDITDPERRLTAAPILIGAGAWVCAGAFVGPGVTIGAGAVAAARAVVVRDVEPWTVVGGNPARFIKKRVLRGPREPGPVEDSRERP